MNAIEQKFYDAFMRLIQDQYSSLWTNERSLRAKAIYKKTDASHSCREEDVEFTLVYDTYCVDYKNPKHNIGQCLLQIDQQFAIGGYKLDFFISSSIPFPYFAIAIEIDGHEWHEKTKEQSAYDKRRDRYLVSRGYPVLRFTGSEVYTNPTDCAKEALDVLLGYYIGMMTGHIDMMTKWFNLGEKING